MCGKPFGREYEKEGNQWEDKHPGQMHSVACDHGKRAAAVREAGVHWPRLLG